jgi:hypothetical protein
MDTPEPTRRRWLSPPEITVLAFVLIVASLVGCFVVWKWSEAVRRQRCLDDIDASLISRSITVVYEPWSTQWPFRNVTRVTAIALPEGALSDDYVGTLQGAFPGVPITPFVDDPSLDDVPALPDSAAAGAP